MTIKKLTAMPYAQAHIEIDDNGNQYLYSYVTLVAGIENGLAFCNGLHSMTTRKHIGAFAKENGLDYQTFKKLFEDNMTMDIATGEIEEREG